MFDSIFKIKQLFIFFFLISGTFLKAEIINEINVEGNQRISSETIEMFADVSINNDLSEDDIKNAMRVGIKVILDTKNEEIYSISAGNYGGKLGPYLFKLKEVINA